MEARYVIFSMLHSLNHKQKTVSDSDKYNFFENEEDETF